MSSLLGWLIALSVSATPTDFSNDLVLLQRNPYVMNVSPTEATLLWKTLLPGSDSLIWGTLTGEENVIFEAGWRQSHHIRLTGLAPNTCYRYRVVHWGESRHRSQFCTAPDIESPFVSFAVLGDSGSGSAEQFAVADNIHFAHPDLIIHTGDVVYPSGEAKNYDPFYFAPYQKIIDHAPMFLALGNHDIMTKNGQPYFDAFELPHNNPINSEAFYSFQWGHILFIALNSNSLVENSPDKTIQLEWLENELKNNNLPWVVIFLHHPVYSSGKHGSTKEVQEALLPILKQHHVQMVFAGHDHNYERTRIINGTLYIVTGGGGNLLYPVTPDPEFSEAATSEHHHVEVQIYEDTVSLTAIDKNGWVIDSTFLRRGDFDYTRGNHLTNFSPH